MVNVRKGLAWLKEQPGVDGDRIGIMGISMGAILSSLLIEVQPGIQAAVLFLGGGNLPGIFKTSKEDPIADFRERSLEKIQPNGDPTDANWEKFIAEAREVLGPVDPLKYPSLLPPERILMVNGYFDAVIKKSYTQELWTHLKEPTLIYLPAGHYGSVLFFHYARYKALQHFNRFLAVN